MTRFLDGNVLIVMIGYFCLHQFNKWKHQSELQKVQDLSNKQTQMLLKLASKMIRSHQFRDINALAKTIQGRKEEIAKHYSKAMDIAQENPNPIFEAVHESNHEFNSKVLAGIAKSLSEMIAEGESIADISTAQVTYFKISYKDFQKYDN